LIAALHVVDAEAARFGWLEAGAEIGVHAPVRTERLPGRVVAVEARKGRLLGRAPLVLQAQAAAHGRHHAVGEAVVALVAAAVEVRTIESAGRLGVEVVV
nr:hypothetical protein [Tanacetum cinerariifolium]